MFPRNFDLVYLFIYEVCVALWSARSLPKRRVEDPNTSQGGWYFQTFSRTVGPSALNDFPASSTKARRPREDNKLKNKCICMDNSTQAHTSL